MRDVRCSGDEENICNEQERLASSMKMCRPTHLTASWTKNFSFRKHMDDHAKEYSDAKNNTNFAKILLYLNRAQCSFKDAQDCLDIRSLVSRDPGKSGKQITFAMCCLNPLFGHSKDTSNTRQAKEYARRCKYIPRSDWYIWWWRI